MSRVVGVWGALLFMVLGCGADEPPGPPVVRAVSLDGARTAWLDGWALPRAIALQKGASRIDQARGSELRVDLTLPAQPSIRGSARLRSGHAPELRGVPIRGRVSIDVESGDAVRRVLDHPFEMPAEFATFAWNERLDALAGRPVTLVLRMDPGPPSEGAPASHRKLRVDWLDLRVEGFANAP